MTTPFWAPGAAHTLRQADGLLTSAVLRWFEALCDQPGRAPATPLDRLIRESLGGAGAVADTAAGPGRPAPRGPTPRGATPNWPDPPSHGGRRPAAGSPGAAVQPDLPLVQWPPALGLGPGGAMANRQAKALQQPARTEAGVAASAAPGTAAASPTNSLPARFAGAPWPPVEASPTTAAVAALSRSAPPGVDDPSQDRPASTGSVASLLDRRNRRDRLQDRLAVAGPRPALPAHQGFVGTRPDLTGSPPLPSWPRPAPVAAVASSRALGAQRRVFDAAGPALDRVWPVADGHTDAAAGAGVSTARAASSADPTLPTRLVTGLPALQGLLSATLADSRQRHTEAMPPDTWPHSLGGAPHPASTATVPALVGVSGAPSAALGARSLPTAQGLLPGLDALAEEMLVDHLADRLAERLRDQALRQHGFTGGWL